jgi:hypothetical protein
LRWPSFSSTTSAGWLAGDARPVVSGILLGSETGNREAIEGSQGFQVVATAIGTIQIVWSDGMDSQIAPSTLGPS